MAQVEFGIVGKNVVESELNYNFCSIFDVLHIFGSIFDIFQICLQNGGNSIFLPIIPA